MSTNKEVINGHVIKVCSCGKDTCPICVWSAAICENCGMAESELTEPCPTACLMTTGIGTAVKGKRGASK